MEQYISKSAVVAEIESKIEKYTKRGEESDAKHDGYGMYWGGVISCLNEVRTLCDTIKVKDFWKSADGEDLPDIDRGVIVLIQPYPLKGSEYVVSFAHRPNPNGWDGKSVTTGKVEHYTPKTYDKGGWSIPNVVWWLDCDLPKKEET